MKSSPAWNALVRLFGLASVGCGMAYLQHGYYQSWGLPGWSYSLEGGQCTFLHQSRPDVAFQIRLSGEDGQVGFVAHAELPEGEAFRYGAAAASVLTASGERRAAPFQAVLKTPLQVTEDPGYRVTEQALSPGSWAEGCTFLRPRALVFRRVCASVEFRGSFALGEGQDFTLELPSINYGKETLAAFKACFHWNNGTIHLLRQIQ